MSIDQELALFELRRVRLEMEHQELLDSRNALWIAQFTVPFAFLAIPNEFGLIGNGLVALACGVGFVWAYSQIQDRKLRYNALLRAKRKEVEDLITEMENKVRSTTKS